MEITPQSHSPLSFSNEGLNPVKIAEVEISKPLQDIHVPGNPAGPAYQRVLVLVRLHSYPLGLVEIELKDSRLTAADLSAHIWDRLGSQINQHLQGDGIPPVDCTPRRSLPDPARPRCQGERQAVWRAAPLVSVIIATRDRVESLADTMDALLAVEYPNFEIILVDNAPKTNETLEYWMRIQPQFSQRNIEVRYVLEEIPGLAVAHNRGLKEVRGSIVAFTDDDVIVDRYWLVELVRGVLSADSVGCVTGLVIPYEMETPSQVLFEQFGGFTKGFTRQIYSPGENPADNPLFPYTAGRFGTGANMAFTALALKEIGGFDPALGAGTPAYGADDLASFYQTIAHGLQLVYQPSALAFHRHRRTYEGLRKQMLGYGVGLTAFLTKCMLDDPACIFDIASRIPAGIQYIFNPSSEKNHRKPGNYPPELDRIERAGMLYGPLAYLYSRWRYRRNLANSSS